MTGRHLPSFQADARGVTIVEFAMVLPVMLTLIMGLGEVTYQAYVQSVLTGAMQKAGRDSTIQSADTSAIDQKVIAIVWKVAGSATYTSSRKNVAKFGYVNGEPFTDTNGNGIHDTHECFTDTNGNGVYDADISASGQGGASDVTVYTMTITYPHLFPVAKWFGWGAKQTLSATTILKNQPYTSQGVVTETTICP
jgi:Flp pilus assembly protein TadG